MRNTFAKRLLSGALALMMAACMAVPAFADDAKQYVITLRPGEHGAYTAADAEGFKGKPGVADAAYLSDTGAIALLMNADSPLPNLPAYPTVAADSKYYVYDQAPGYLPALVVDRDMDFVTEYAVSAQGTSIPYTVQYVDVDARTTEVAPAMQGTAGGEQIVLRAPSVDYYRLVLLDGCGYTAEGEYKATLNKDDASKNVFTFYYAYDPTHIPGRTIVQTVTVGGGTGAGGTGTGGEVINPDEPGGGEVIDDPNAPLEPGPGGGEDIEDSDTPLAPGAEQPAGGINGMTVAAGAGGIALIALLIALLARRKKQTEDGAA